MERKTNNNPFINKYYFLPIDNKAILSLTKCPYQQVYPKLIINVYFHFSFSKKKINIMCCNNKDNELLIISTLCYIVPVYLCFKLHYKLYMSLVMRKPAFCICENKDADQLGGNREADRRLCFRYTDSTIPLLPCSEISSI